MRYKKRAETWHKIRSWAEQNNYKIFDGREGMSRGVWGSWIDLGNKMRFVGKLDSYDIESIENDDLWMTEGKIDAVFYERDAILAILNALESDAQNACQYTQELIDVFYTFALKFL